MALGDVFRVTLEHSYVSDGIAVQNVLWFKQTSESPVGDEAIRLASAVEGVWTNPGIGGGIPKWFWSPNFVLGHVLSQKMAFDHEAPNGFSPPTTQIGAGDDASHPVPSVCTFVVTLLAARGGRRGRGRLYLGGIAARRPNNPGAWADYNTVNQNSRWSASLSGDIQAWMEAIADHFDGETVNDADSGGMWQWGVWSRAIGGNTPPFNVAGFSPIVGITHDSIIRVQRRREYGHGI